MQNSTEKELLFKVLDDMGEVKDRLHSIDKTLIKQNIDLELHIKRTDIAEKKLEILEQDIKPSLEAFQYVKKSIKLTLKIISILVPIVYYYLKYMRVE
jgi:hypothetical protein